MRGPSVMFSQFLMKAGMLRETGTVPVAVREAPVRQTPRDPQPGGRDPSPEENQKSCLCQKQELNLLR